MLRSRLSFRGCLEVVLRTRQNNNILSSAAIYVLGNVLQKAAAFLLIPIYTYYLSPDDFGITGIVQSVNQVLTILVALGINSAVQRYYYEYYRDNERLRQYVSSTFLFLTVAVSGTSLVLSLHGAYLWGLFFPQVPFIPYAQLMIWTVWGSVLTQYALNLYQARQEAGRFVITQIGGFLLSSAVTVYLVVCRHFGARGQLTGLLVGSVVTALISSILLLREYATLKVSWNLIRVSLVYGLPLIPHLIAQWAKTSLDRFFLANYSTLDEVGVYTLGHSIGLVMHVIMVSTNQAYTPYYFDMMKRHSHPEDRFRRVVAVYVTIFGFICLVGVLFSPELLKILAPPRYFPAAEVVPLILFGFLISGYYFLFVNPLFYFEKTGWVPWLTGTAAAASIGLNFILVPRLGALGAAMTFATSALLTFVLTFYISRQFWKVELPYGRYLLLNTLLGLVVTWMTVRARAQPLGMSTWVVKPLIVAVYALTAYVLVLGKHTDWFVFRLGSRGKDTPEG